MDGQVYILKEYSDGMQIDLILYIDLSGETKMLVTYLWQRDCHTLTFLYI